MKIKNERISLLVNALGNLDADKVYLLAGEFLSQGATPLMIQQFMNIGMKLVGEYYQSGEYFLADMLYASYIYNNVLKNELMQMSEDTPKKGLVVIGNVLGDMHEMAKSIVSNTLSSNGFKVIDLGVDLKTSIFIEAVKRYKPDILAISCMMSSALDEIGKITDALEKEHLKENVKIIVGGNPSLAIQYKELGADLYGSDAVSGLEVCLTLTGENDHA